MASSVFVIIPLAENTFNSLYFQPNIKICNVTTILIDNILNISIPAFLLFNIFFSPNPFYLINKYSININT